MKQHKLIEEFSTTIRWLYKPDSKISESLKNLLASLEGVQIISKSSRANLIFYHVNRKFRLNIEGIRVFLKFASTHKITFNYHEKLDINKAFDENQGSILTTMLSSHKKLTNNVELSDLIMSVFSPISKKKTLECLHLELKSPTLTRKDSKPKDRSNEILTSLFSAYIYSSFPENALHEINDPISAKHQYFSKYWKHLHSNHPDLFSRDNALSILHITEKNFNNCNGYEKLENQVLEYIQDTYTTLTNHGYLAILVDPIFDRGESLHWKLFSDCILYAEKHVAYKHKQYFFKSKEIENATVSYIPSLDLKQAKFSVMNSGFHYQDTFIVGPESKQKILLLFQKNEPDETLIPCPACRSNNVQGNSYSSLGVKSWECKNQFCPDRSKFNRGKRYSFLQVLKQNAIEDERNAIPESSVRHWVRDVQLEMTDHDILEMLIRHYSLIGDTIRLHGWSKIGRKLFDRRIVAESFDNNKNPSKENGSIPPSEFFNSSYFRRYLIERRNDAPTRGHKTVDINKAKAVLGDSFDVLLGMESNIFDGAVTSPPYYNAREYSQWENIYTYLYDMYNINKEVFRVLKEGGVYLFNIFDYFDNERNVALSAMGEKRMILGAYIINMFQKIGFKVVSNVIWDKGDIEGKRGFNNGNFSPYYQSPFNCWEHILIFKKPGDNVSLLHNTNTYLREKPVIKIVKGKNTYGHTAPFPLSIPNLLMNMLVEDSLILDPFGGSMTTGIAASKQGSRSVCIELNEKYFQLGISKLEEVARKKQV